MRLSRKGCRDETWVDDMNLDGKVAFVTGGSEDIGSAIARAFAAAGADVALSYVGHLEGAKATASAVEALGRRSLILQSD